MYDDLVKRQHIEVTLAQRIQSGGATGIADATVMLWQEIDTALSPVLGKQGVAALYRRSLHVTAAAWPWLAGLSVDLAPSLDLAPLKAALFQQSSAHAAAAGDVLLHTFRELLANLVGPSLTDQLLRSVWEGLPAYRPAALIPES